jgi:CheY-like chemotaxis protein
MRRRPAVLVVDDEAGMRETLVDILKMAGYKVTPVKDGASALEMARAHSYDVVVMDIRMPELSGVEVLEGLDFPPPQVVLMTAYAAEEDIQTARDSNVFAIMEKPFQVPYLLRVVADAAHAA